MTNTPAVPTNSPRILIVGAGGIGERHLRCFQLTQQCAVSFCEPKESLREKIAAQYAATPYATLDAAIECGPFDGAVICAPAQTHIPLARKCVAAGIHVLIEKPLSTDLEGISELEQEAAFANRVVRLAYIYRFFPAIQRARHILQSGVLGPVRHIGIISGQNYPSFRPDYRDIYYAHREQGGGAVQDALTHQVHAVEWMVSPVESIVCHARHQVLEGVEVEDTVNLSACLTSGAMASFALNQFQRINESIFTFHAAKASLRVEFPANRVGVTSQDGSQWIWEQLPPQERDAPFIDQALDFLGTLRAEPGCGCTLAEGVQTLRVNLGALQAAREKREILL